MSELDKLVDAGNWEIEPQYMEGYPTGYAEVYYVGDGDFNRAKKELDDIRTALAEAQNLLAEADAVIKPFAELSNRVDTRGFDYISLDVTVKSIKSAAEYIRKHGGHS